MSRLPDAPAVEVATFKVLDGTGAGGEPFAVQFNPASLEYTVSNEFDDRNGNNGARQFVKKSSAKLSMALVFDTTDDGSDVRGQTERLARLMEPAKHGSKQFAPKVEFGWGSYRFKGVIEQYKETIDFFSASGVPLRAGLNLTLSAQEVEFQSNKNPNASVDGNAGFGPVDSALGAAPKDVADALGDPRAARAVAAANASASLRFGAGASLSVGGAIAIGAPVAFSAGASAGAGFSAGAGLSLGGGIGVGLSAGASAGSAFSGLRVGATSDAPSVDAATARSLLPPAAGASAALA
ncbi:MAG: hypothetical protein M3Y32_04220, partial [Pseudomonadota bacterium]|nr:hypothetical protein [Pseudomonadota bacterium]